MFGFFRKFKEAKAAQQALTEAFKARGHDFMTMNSIVHEAMVKEAIATGVEARFEAVAFGNADSFIRHYQERSKQFSR